MNCPHDGCELRMSLREGIEIDYCPSCRGVWLDRGELEKIVERANLALERRPQQSSFRPHPDDAREGSAPIDSRPGRRESFWTSFFDFD